MMKSVLPASRWRAVVAVVDARLVLKKPTNRWNFDTLL
jgi:hypothetical protein